MILSKKIRILPTKKQRILIHKSFGCKRYIYNWGIDQIEDYYKQNNKYLSSGELRKNMTILKQNLVWLKEIGNNVLKRSLIDLDKAYIKFFNKKGGRPKYKKKTTQESFYVNYESCRVGNYKVRCEKLGWIRTKEQLPLTKISNPHISFDGNSGAAAKIAELITDIEKLQHTLPSGYELRLIALLHLLFHEIYLTYVNEPKKPPMENNAFIQQKMIEYIYNHFNEEIILDDIAHAGNVSRSQCAKIFKPVLRFLCTTDRWNVSSDAINSLMER